MRTPLLDLLQGNTPPLPFIFLQDSVGYVVSWSTKTEEESGGNQLIKCDFFLNFMKYISQVEM